MGQIRITEPVIITPRLLPGVRVGGGFVSVQRHAQRRPDGRYVFSYAIDFPGGEHEGSDVTSPRPGLQEALSTVLTFLAQETPPFPADVAEWASSVSDELSLLASQLDETDGLIEESYARNASEPVHVGPPVSRGTREEEHALKEAELQEHMINYLKRKGPQGTPLSMYDAELAQRRGKYRESYRAAFGEEPPPGMVPNAAPIRDARGGAGGRWRHCEAGSFEPREMLYAPNGIKWESYNGLSGYFFIGLNVGDRRKWGLWDVVDSVRSLLRGMGRDEDSSYIVQRGVYTHAKEEGQPDDAPRKVIEEPSVQVVVFDSYPATKPEVFLKQMQDIGTALAEKLQQETIIVDVRRANVSIGTYGMKA